MVDNVEELEELEGVRGVRGKRGRLLIAFYHKVRCLYMSSLYGRSPQDSLG